MNNLNSILVEGNLTRDPELSYTPKGTAVCKFSVGCHRYYRQDEEIQQEVSFFDITVWGRQAEVCSEYLHKGRGVRVVGRLKQDRWQDAEGNNRSKVQIIAEHVEFKPKAREKLDDDGGELLEEPTGAQEPSADGAAADEKEREGITV
jgi:single-strand DNA-binding protein